MELSNLLKILKNFKDKTCNLENIDSENLLKLYKDITIFIYKTMPLYSNEIAYSAQNIQLQIENEFKQRIKKN